MSYLVVKRLLDILFAILLLIILAPILLFVAGAIWVLDGRPIFFVQYRPGLNSKLFGLVKFRTMASPLSKRSRTGAQTSSEFSPQLTRLGGFLRVTSLDELPQLGNILLGQMSFVGPRPLLADYLPLYSVRERARHGVRPGLTGLAQVNGRNCLDWSKKIRMDLQYVENVSFLRDLSIVFRSFAVLLNMRGVKAKSEASLRPSERSHSHLDGNGPK